MKSQIIWVDEAGRWAWAWPVVAACVFWQWRCPIRSMLQDSKKMSPENREKTYHHILELAEKKKLFFAVWIISNDIIDTVGIREANRLAMELALQQIQNTEYPVLCSSKNWEWITTKDEKIQSEGICLMIDGRDNYTFDLPNLPKPEYIVRGDSKIKQIMAASILAKVTRDTLMRDFEKQFSWYGFAQHKGYGTQLHQKTLQKLGVSEIHRRSYRPVSVIT